MRTRAEKLVVKPPHWNSPNGLHRYLQNEFLHSISLHSRQRQNRCNKM